MSVSTHVTLGLTTVVGVLVGAGIGYLVADRRLTKKFEERLETETKGMKEFYTHTPAEKFATPEAAVAALIPDGVITDEKELKKSAAHPRPDTQKTEYHKIAKQYHAPTDTEEIPEEAPRVEVDKVEARNAFAQQKADARGEIYLITQQEFAEGEFLSADLTWYSDGILTDSDEEPINPPSSHIGEVTMADFGHTPEQPDVILVRNHVMSLDFEITRSLTSYAEDVLGEVHEPVDRPSGRGD